MKKPILLSDLLLLSKLYAPKNVALFIFDPRERLILDVDFPLKAVDENHFTVLVSLVDEITCYKGMQLSEFDMVLDFGESKMPSVFKRKQLSYINNPDKSIRWVYSKENKQASFLNFYNTAAARAKLIATTIKLAFKLGLKKLVRSGSFNIYYQQDLHISPLVNQVNHSDYSIFMGTAGPNRSLLLELNNGKASTHFIKIPANEQSVLAIAKEAVNIHIFKNKEFETFNTPKMAENMFNDVLFIENIKSKDASRSNELLTPHFNALSEMAMKTTQFFHLQSTSYWEAIVNSLSQLKGERKYNNVVNQILQLKEELGATKSIYTSLSHGDFTPWNIYVGNDRIHVYDLEQSSNEVPLLNDLFHFHFQSGILSKRIPVNKILENIKEACANDQISKIIETFKIDIDVYFKLYLLKTSASYVAAFQKQQVLSLQHQWLLNAFEEMLAEVCSYQSEKAQRSLFVEEFNSELKRTAHAFLKFTEESLDNLKTSSDLDILVLKEDLSSMVSFCKSHSNVGRAKVYTKSFMTTVELYFKDNTFLSLDLIHQFKRKGIQLIDAKPLLISAMPNSSGVMVPEVKFDFEYCLLFYTLNGAAIPKKYHKHYQAHNEIQNNRVFNYINKKYALKINSNDELFGFNPYLKLRVLSKLEDAIFNVNLNKLKNNINYLLDTAKDMIYRRGLVITFSGVDGAGKTTIIENVKSRLQSKYRKDVVLLRHRPGILPILSAMKHGKEAAEQIASVTMPRKGKNKSVLSSLARFAYYFSDYMIGQVYVYFKYVLRGKIVLYDRYYFDFINDAKRSNIQLNRSFLKALYRLVFKPKLNFFLYADAETILARKQEMIAPEIDQLTILYKNLFGQMSKQYKTSHYTIIENKHLDVTLNTIMNTYAKLA
ncbi:MAG: thymidylate kinase [Patiriisocius sp.]|jgi:thymidylate kinase